MADLMEAVLGVFEKNLDYARRLVADVPAERMCYQPAPKMNHAVWVIGHLARTTDFAGKILGLPPGGTPAAWGELFGGKSTPQTDASKYPDMATLLKALEDGHARLASAIRNAPPELFTKPMDEPFRSKFPTVGQALVHILVGHENMHLGQLSAWRRVQGLPPV